MNSYLRQLIGRSKTLNWIAIIAAGGFVLGLILQAFGNIRPDLAYIPATILSKIQLNAGFKGLVYQPWSLFTYWTYHPSILIFQFIFNILFLYTFGGLLQQFLGEQKFRRFMIFMILGIGVLTWIIISLLATPETEAGGNLNGYVFGLSGPILGTILAAVLLRPSFRVQLFLFGQVKIIWVGIILIALRLLQIKSYLSQPEIFAMLSGLAIGASYVLLLKRKVDLTAWMAFSWVKGKKPKKVKRKLKVVKGPDEAGIVSEDDVNLILDKINKVGYNGLTRHEKEILAKAAEQD